MNQNLGRGLAQALKDDISVYVGGSIKLKVYPKWGINLCLFFLITKSVTKVTEAIFGI